MPCRIRNRNCLFYIIPLGAAHTSLGLFTPFYAGFISPQSIKIIQLKPIFFGANIAPWTALIWLLTVETESYRKSLYCFRFPLWLTKKKKMLFAAYLTGQSVHLHSLTCKSEAIILKSLVPPALNLSKPQQDQMLALLAVQYASALLFFISAIVLCSTAQQNVCES